MWKTHSFRRALGPLLKQLDADYDIPAEQQDGPEPVDDDGSPFRFLPPAPVVLYCKNSPPLKKVVMQPADDAKIGFQEQSIFRASCPPSLSQGKNSSFWNLLVFLLQASTEENSSEETQSSRRDSSSGNSGKTTTQSQPDLPPSASKKRSAPEPAVSQTPIKAGQGSLRTKSRCIKRARKEPQASSSNQEISNTDDTSSGEVEEVPMPSATLDLATSKSVADKVANLAKPTAETQEPITSSSAVPLVLGEVKLWPVVTLSAYRSRVKSARQRIDLRHAQLPLKADIADKCQRLNEKKAALDAKTDTSVSTAELETLRKELEDLEERVRATKQLIQDKEALIAHSHEEAEGLKAELKTDLAEIRALNKQLVAGKDEDDEAEIAEVDRVRVDALHALEAFLQ
ncbi:hypothetical protein QYE76_059077 [Lolium multiflorum]|uniref:Uncharacterized protein n=1 Tax=Lolium multiflorum TaxID=4521 RepID=A0AAD8T6P5_LOLMU|nr:hypothetical protein QYE76_059077 [Lolium multiflorum]